MLDNAIDVSLSKTLLQKILIFWKTREVGYKTELLLKILPVAIYADHLIFPKELQKAREILAEHINDSEEVEYLLERIELRLNDYIKDYKRFLKDKKEVLEIISNDIQLYGVIKDIFSVDGSFDNDERKMEFLINQEFNKKWNKK